MERQISIGPGVNTVPALETSVKSSGSVQLKQVLIVITSASECFFNGSAQTVPSSFLPLLGNELLHNLTSVGPVSLRVDLGSGNNTAYAHYANFSIDSAERHYTLTVSGYSGTAGEKCIKVEFSRTCPVYTLSYSKCLTIHTSVSLYISVR